MSNTDNRKKMDFTSGPIMKGLLVFSVPLFLNNVFQNLYNIVDSLVVGIYQSKEALAAIGASTAITNVVLGFFTGLSAGSTIMIASNYGSRKEKELKESIMSAIVYSLAIGLMFTIVGVLLSKRLLMLTTCPDDILEQATLYLAVFFLGSIFTALYNACSTILLAVGDSKTPFKYLVIASFMKTGLVMLLVAVMKTGVLGAALSTVLAQGVSGIMIFIYLTRIDEEYRIDIHQMRNINFPMMKKMLVLALPVAFQQVIVRLSFLIPQHYVNSFGTDAIAGISVGQKIYNLAMIPASVINVVTTTFVSQNMAIENKKRTLKGMGYSAIIGFSAAVVMVALIYGFAPNLVRLFNNDPGVLGYGVKMIRTVCPFLIVMAIYDVFSGSLKGFGMTKTVLWSTVITVVIIPIIYLLFVMNRFGNIEFIYWYYPLAWTLYFMILLVIFINTVNNKIRY